MMATAVVADHGLDVDERAYLNLGLETVSAFRLCIGWFRAHCAVQSTFSTTDWSGTH